MSNTKTNSSGKTMYRVFFNGIDYGYMTAKAEREFLARQAAK
jgi:hypothetical protein